MATDWYNLNTTDNIRNWGGIKMEYVFDNTKSPTLNIYYGSRYKVFAEYYKQLKKYKGNDIAIVGIDFRKYTKISRTIILANRIAASTSAFASDKLIYYLGGVDTWLAPKFNKSVDVDPSQNYAYQTLATNMRGFEQNIRNGTNFALINNEIRFPIVKYFAQHPIKSDFFSNLQIITFMDAGVAWTGKSPYDEDNTFFKTTYYAKPLKITVKTQKEPIVFGYGLGLRTKILGYFLRADWAWGIEDKTIQPMIFYLSLSLDF